MIVLNGVGADAPVLTNAAGGKQSHIPFRFDLLLRCKSIAEVAKIMAEGAEKYGAENWHNISSQEHLNHALTHISAYQLGDTQDDHIGHAVCRMIMAHEMSMKEEAAEWEERVDISSEVDTDNKECDSPKEHNRITGGTYIAHLDYQDNPLGLPAQIINGKRVWC